MAVAQIIVGKLNAGATAMEVEEQRFPPMSRAASFSPVFFHISPRSRVTNCSVSVLMQWLRIARVASGWAGCEVLSRLALRENPLAGEVLLQTDRLQWQRLVRCCHC